MLDLGLLADLQAPGPAVVPEQLLDPLNALDDVRVPVEPLALAKSCPSTNHIHGKGVLTLASLVHQLLWKILLIILALLLHREEGLLGLAGVLLAELVEGLGHLTAGPDAIREREDGAFGSREAGRELLILSEG